MCCLSSVSFMSSDNVCDMTKLLKTGSRGFYRNISQNNRIWRKFSWSKFRLNLLPSYHESYGLNVHGHSLIMVIMKCKRICSLWLSVLFAMLLFSLHVCTYFTLWRYDVQIKIVITIWFTVLILMYRYWTSLFAIRQKDK